MFLQDITVSLIALAAAATVVWRALALFTAKPTTPGCPSCASGCASRPTTVKTNADHERKIIRPLVIHARTASRDV